MKKIISKFNEFNISEKTVIVLIWLLCIFLIVLKTIDVMKYTNTNKNEFITINKTEKNFNLENTNEIEINSSIITLEVQSTSNKKPSYEYITKNKELRSSLVFKSEVQGTKEKLNFSMEGDITNLDKNFIPKVILKIPNSNSYKLNIITTSNLIISNAAFDTINIDQKANSEISLISKGININSTNSISINGFEGSINFENYFANKITINQNKSQVFLTSTSSKVRLIDFKITSSQNTIILQNVIIDENSVDKKENIIIQNTIKSKEAL